MGITNVRAITSVNTAVNRAASRLEKGKSYSRPSVPRRGVFALKSEKYAIDGYERVSSMYLDYLKGLGSAYQSLLTFEEFQKTQKGPVGPITKEQFADMTYKKYALLRVNSSSVSKQEIDAIFDKLYTHFSSKGRFDVKEIDFAAEGRTLPSTTIRGFPYMTVGKNVDEEIIKEGGSSYGSALAYFQKIDSLVTFPGLRFQGKPVKEGAKVRVIHIPSVYYQYINVGIYHNSMKVLKQFNSFVGGYDHNEMFSKLTRMYQWLKNNNYGGISLDFSRFDTTVVPYYREKANALLEKLCNADAKYFEHGRTLNQNQVMVCLNERSNLDLLDVNYQLLSGVINTQQDGSIVNLFVQCFIAKKLGYELPLDCALALGDDVGMPVPNEILERLGYQGLLRKIKEIVSLLGMITHDKKAYPEAGLVFLQRLYDQPNGVGGHGSFLRNLASFIGPEKFPMAVPGVKNMAALHLISQISILSVPFSKSKLNSYGFYPFLAKEWLAVDPYLNSLAWSIKSNGGRGDDLFRLLVKLVGEKAYIEKFMDAQSYDHTGLKAKLDAVDYGAVFPIVNEIVAHCIESDLQPALSSDNQEEDLDELE